MIFISMAITRRVGTTWKLKAAVTESSASRKVFISLDNLIAGDETQKKNNKTNS